MLPKKLCYENQAATIIKNLEKRNMKGFYCSTALEAKELAMNMIPAGSVVAFGGTQSLEENGMKEDLWHRKDLTVYGRKPTSTIEEIQDLYQKSFSADYYLMSTNAISMDGELLNIDGMGNRVAAMIYGPKHVIVIAGMNKVGATMEACIARARNIAAPMNCNRLDKNTPCSKTGKCHNCLSTECICSQIVYTRYSAIPGRIQVILVGEELGY